MSSRKFFVLFYFTLKNEEVQNAIPIFFPKVGDINSPNLRV